MKSTAIREQRMKATPTQNACKLCAPLGASLAFRGIQGAMTVLHGSQGCATYIRRYVIGHFREPIDIASSSFTEETTIFGGAKNLKDALQNVLSQYRPSLIGVASTCLSETIGEDLEGHVREFCRSRGDLPTPPVVTVATPSYRGTHMDGLHTTTQALVKKLAEKGPGGKAVNVFPGMVSPADLRLLREIVESFGLAPILISDYSDTLDGGSWKEYERIPSGGTSLDEIRRSGAATGSLQFGHTVPKVLSGAEYLFQAFGVPSYPLGLPIGIRETDRFLEALSTIAGRPVPLKYQAERARLVDAYVDGHKYVFGKRAAVYGEEDLVVGIASILSEIGVKLALCASGGNSGALRKALDAAGVTVDDNTRIISNADFEEIGRAAEESGADLLIGHSKGYSIARKMNIPLVRVGFPVHDRIGGQRILHLGYEGSTILFDRIVNAIIERTQSESPIGYLTY